MAGSTPLLSPRRVSPVATALSFCGVHTGKGVQRYCFLQGLYKGVRNGAQAKTAIAVRKHAIDAECGVRRMLHLACDEPVTRNRRQRPFPLEISGSGVCRVFVAANVDSQKPPFATTRRHLSEFAQYLSRTGIPSFSQLSPTVLVGTQDDSRVQALWWLRLRTADR
jgi:hypothetical protein